MEIDHLTVPVSDYEASKAFYERALAPLGLVVLLDSPDRRRAFFGVKGEPSSLWVVESGAAGSLDVTLAADSTDTVDWFYSCPVQGLTPDTARPDLRAEPRRDPFAELFALVLLKEVPGT